MPTGLPLHWFAGKQSLARLAAFICGYEVFQIAVSSTYGVPEFKAVRCLICGTLIGHSAGSWLTGVQADWPGQGCLPSGCPLTICSSSTPPPCRSPHPQPATLQDLISLYQKAGAKGVPVVLLLTDNQLTKEAFLVYVNDLLANGDVPDLCTTEDRDNFCNTVRGCDGRVWFEGVCGLEVGGEGEAAVRSA